MELAQQDLLPSWSLFVFKKLKQSAKGHPPQILSYGCEDVFVIGPHIREGMLHGFVIAKETSYERVRTLQSPCGRTVIVRMPRFDGKVYATETQPIRLLRDGN